MPGAKTVMVGLRASYFFCACCRSPCALSRSPYASLFSFSGGRVEDATPKCDGTHNMHDRFLAENIGVNHETEIANPHKNIANPHKMR